MSKAARRKIWLVTECTDLVYSRKKVFRINTGVQCLMVREISRNCWIAGLRARCGAEPSVLSRALQLSWLHSERVYEMHAGPSLPCGYIYIFTFSNSAWSWSATKPFSKCVSYVDLVSCKWLLFKVRSRLMPQNVRFGCSSYEEKKEEFEVINVLNVYLFTGLRFAFLPFVDSPSLCVQTCF